MSRPLGPAGPYQRPRKLTGTRAIKMSEIAREAALQGITPVELMMNAMREFNDEAEEAFKCAEECDNEKTKQELRSYGRTMIQMAVEVAKDAAPYVHARLNAVTVSGDPDAPLQIELLPAHALKSMVRGSS